MFSFTDPVLQRFQIRGKLHYPKEKKKKDIVRILRGCVVFNRQIQHSIARAKVVQSVLFNEDFECQHRVCLRAKWP